MSSIRQITIGSAAMSSVTVLRMMVQLLIMPIMARYLSPAEYGIVAMAMPFVLFALMFSDAGISNSLIRSQNKDVDTEWSTCFWLTAILGFILSVIISAVGYGLSIFMNEPQLFPIITVLSFIIIIQATATVPGAKLQQLHKFPQVAGIEISSMILGLTAAVVAAMHGFGAWALVIQQIVQFLPRLILTLIISPFRPRMMFDLKMIKEHLDFGKNVMGMNIINFIRQPITNTLIGKISGTSQVGIYSMATVFSELPNRIVSGPVQNVLYPHMAKLKDAQETTKSLFLMVSKLIAILVTPTIGMLAVAHSPVFTIILSDKWEKTGEIFMLLAAGVVVGAISSLRNGMAMAYGRTDILFKQTVEVTILHILMLLITVNFGIEFVAIGVSVVIILYTPRSLYQIFKLIDLSMITYIKAIIIPIILTILAIGGYLIINHFYPTNTNWEKFLIAVTLGIVTVLTSVLIQFKGIKSEVNNLRMVLK